MVHLLMLVLWLAMFLTSSGLYFSARFLRTTSAVVATFALAFLLWAVAPPVLGFAAAATDGRKSIAACALANPVLQAGVIAHGASGRRNAHKHLSQLRYEWLYENSKVGPTTVVLLLTMFFYIAFGVVFAWRAKSRFRRNVF